MAFENFSITANSMTKIGEIIRKRRKSLGLTQVMLAEKTGTSIRCLSEIEQGKKTAQINKVLTLLLFLDVECVLTHTISQDYDIE